MYSFYRDFQILYKLIIPKYGQMNYLIDTISVLNNEPKLIILPHSPSF